jgi:hypothetical protein
VTRRTQLLIAGVLAGIGILVLVGIAFAGPRSVRSYVADHYQRSRTSDAALAGALVYTSSRQPREVANDIASAWRPADRHTDPAGYFLRYRNDIVVVSPSGSGTRITVDDEHRGYARWYPFIGGYWGTYSGAGEGFRGGGPGAGK